MAHRTQFTQGIDDHPSFPSMEEEVYNYWNEINAFQKQLEMTKHMKPYTFYDGPPFATGLPHYGHICAGTIKDIVCRYFSQTGFYVQRRFGWDCHGLPVEYEIDKTIGIKHKNDVYKMGIDKYNAECRSIVMRYSGEWRKIIGRTGRWIDFDNDYKTLDLKFMESVWWVFKQLWEKGLVYRGCKVMPYSNACNTVLSNFETQQNYKETLDPSIHILFPWVSDPETNFVAWTTTPWTLPSNLALNVHPDFVYLKIYDKQHKKNFIIAECRLADLYPQAKSKDTYDIIQKYKGTDLVGIEYVPLFNYFIDRKKDGCFKVLADTYVTNDTGTGIVHCAPGFGAEDYKVSVKFGIIRPDDPPIPIDENGVFTDIVTDFKGMYIKDADKEVRKYLRNSGRLLNDSQVRHNYPFCWRSDTALIYKAVHTWFIKVTQIKDNLVANNKKSVWVPLTAQEGRFNNWLENAEDWCFSRNRFWGNPIPIWVSQDYEEQVCIGSVEELQRLSGVKDITDLHRESIDHITIPSQQGKGNLRRIDEIFDCWFESGSMPFAQQHYPFSMKEEQFKQIFPADFIAEGIDQTRGWFYTLNVLATALRNDTPYKNLIVNGIVLNDEGKKMSKSKKNYPDPMNVINAYGADALRLYLINSPVVRGESLNFKEVGVQGTVKDVFLPWYNAYRFLIQNITRYEKDANKTFVFHEEISLSGKLTNQMDRWIIACEQDLIKFVRKEMEGYRLYTVVSELLKFLENLTNWYVRLNRLRLKGDTGQDDQLIALNVLFDVLLKLNILMSPFVPFITDSFYQNLKKAIKSQQYSAESIHFLQIPEFNQNLIDPKIEQDLTRMQDVITKARKIREIHNISLKQPITSLTVITTNDSLINSLNYLRTYIEEEVNVPQLIFEKNVQQFVELKAEPDNKICGKELGEKFCKDFIAKVRTLSQEQIVTLQKEGKLTIDIVIQREKKQVQQQPVQEEEQKEEAKDDQKGKKGAKKQQQKKQKEFEDFNDTVTFEAKHVIIKENYKTENLPKYLILSVEEDYSLLLDTRQDDKLKIKGLAREFTNRIQKLRKQAKLNVEDKILVFYSIDEKQKFLKHAIETEFKAILNQVKNPIFPISAIPPCATLIKNGRQVFEVEEFSFELTLTYDTIMFNNQQIINKYDAKINQMVQQTLGSFSTGALHQRLVNGVFKLTLNGQVIELKQGEDFYLNSSEAVLQ